MAAASTNRGDNW